MKLTEPLDGAQFAAGGKAVDLPEFGRMIREYMADVEAKGGRVSTADAAAAVIRRDGLRVA
jgi:hypothetical protein